VVDADVVDDIASIIDLDLFFLVDHLHLLASDHLDMKGTIIVVGDR
jgi:hypothetical protein